MIVTERKKTMYENSEKAVSISIRWDRVVQSKHN